METVDTAAQNAGDIMKLCTLIYSGGMDSTTLLYWLIDAGYRVRALSFDYGQRHRRELVSASTICRDLKVAHQIIKLDFLGGSALTGEGAIPHGHYESEQMKQTVVANRNMVMISIAASVAIQQGSDAVAYGCHAGDHAIYPDCRPEFVATMAAAVRLCDWHQLELLAPFVSISKSDIAIVGKRLSVPFEKTWTCYNGNSAPCGRCGACVERAESFGA